jgi:hypothetical protein
LRILLNQENLQLDCRSGISGPEQGSNAIGTLVAASIAPALAEYFGQFPPK